MDLSKLKPIGFEEAKVLELDILKQVATYCEENGLRYFLTYGSLIGAIRHKGFIPWDDDIDIQMPRADYLKLIRDFNEKIPNKELFLVSPDSSIARHPIVKIIDQRTVKVEPGYDYSNGALGIDIDVFPIDGMPENEKEYKRWRRKLMWNYNCFNAAKQLKEGSFKHRVKLFLIGTHRYPANYWLEKAAKLHAEYPMDACSYAGSMEMLYNGPGNRVRKECFDDYIMADFEDTKFRIPVGYDELLTSIYGDYMKLPPAEWQVTHHTNNTFWKTEC